jgi:membrane protein DedA with SNARE-associated domain
MEQLTDALDFVARHEAPLVFATVLAGQCGLPVPAEPVLLAAGALAVAAGGGLAGPLALAVVAGVAGDLLWYEVGRRRGRSVLGVLCRISLEPDACVRRTEDFFARRGAFTVFLSKFVPGLTNATPALAGISRMPLARFLPLDAAATAAWAGLFVGLGFAFGRELERLEGRLASIGGSLGAVVAGAFGLYLAVKAFERWRFLRAHRLARISAEELRARLDRGEPAVVVDLRQRAEAEREPFAIPGALRLDPDEIEARRAELPAGVEVVLYCT